MDKITDSQFMAAIYGDLLITEERVGRDAAEMVLDGLRHHFTANAPEYTAAIPTPGATQAFLNWVA